MPALTAEQIGALRPVISVALNYSYAQAIQSQDIWTPQVVMQGPKARDSFIKLAWLQDRARFREVRRGVSPTYMELLGFDHTINLRYWDKSIRVDVMDLSNDLEGMIAQRTSEIGATLARVSQEMCVDALNNGETSAYPMFDGLPWFSSTHSKGGSTLDNLLGPLTFDKAGIQTVATAFRQFPSDDGATKPLNFIMSHLVVHPSQIWNAYEFVRNSTIGQGTTATNAVENVIKGIAIPLTDGELDDTNDWFGLMASAWLKPFIYVEHETENLRILEQTDRSGNNPAYRDSWEYRWAIQSAQVTYPTLPETGIKVVN
jgi:phage major head subunit gpT-like protein